MKHKSRAKQRSTKHETFLYIICSILLLLSHVSKYFPKQAVLEHLQSMFLGATDQVPHPKTGNIK
jgi:hypothetical protein